MAARHTDFARFARPTAVAALGVASLGLLALSPLSGGHAASSAASKEFDDGFEFKREWTNTAGNRSRDENWERIQEQVGKKAPRFRVGEWYAPSQSDPAKSRREMEGEIIVVDFWATWCPPCRRALPKTSEIAGKYAERGVEVIGICNTRGSDTMESVGREHGLRFPTAADDNDRTSRDYGVQWWPYYVIIDRDGYVRGAGIRPDKVETVVKALLEAQPPRGEGDAEEDGSAPDAEPDEDEQDGRLPRMPGRYRLPDYERDR